MIRRDPHGAYRTPGDTRTEELHSLTITSIDNAFDKLTGGPYNRDDALGR
jgi:hypothetical protein